MLLVSPAKGGEATPIHMGMSVVWDHVNEYFLLSGELATEDGTQVAVKLRSDSSNQEVKEFLAEVGWISSEPIHVSG